MPKKKRPESPEEQSARFVKHAKELISAGKLDPEEGAKALDRLMKGVAQKRHPSGHGT